MKNTIIQARIEVPLGDSREVLVEYYRGKILQLEKALNRLNLLEHPIEIESICAQIIAVKSRLNHRKAGK
jgi:hypothetical protein